MKILLVEPPKVIIKKKNIYIYIYIYIYICIYTVCPEKKCHSNYSWKYTTKNFWFFTGKTNNIPDMKWLIPICVCFCRKTCKHVTRGVPSHHGGWRVYTPSFLGVPGVTVGLPRTKGTASNEQVHSFCGFLPNPFIQDLCLWSTSQEFVKTDLYPLSQGLWSLSGMLSVWPGTGR